MTAAERRKEIIRLAEAGSSGRVIAATVGVSPAYVSKTCVDSGFRRIAKRKPIVLRDVVESIPVGITPQVRAAIVALPIDIRLRLIVTESCWFWNGSHRKHDGRPVIGKEYVYRVIYEHLVGPVPDGSVLHHRTCNVKRCVNPWHTAPITQSEHMREHGFGGDARAGQALKTHCPAGHPYDDENTRRITVGDGSKERRCRTCERITSARYVANHLEETRTAAREYQRRKRNAKLATGA